jgi:ketosteroid isomerase-like protein
MGARHAAMCVPLLLIAACMKAPQETPEDTQKEINQLFASWQKAFEAKDVKGVMAIYAPGNTLVAYDIVAPLQYKGADAYGKDYESFFAQFDGPIHVELRDSHVEAAGGIAFAYGLEHLTGRLKGGESADIWIRYTEGLRRIDDKWRVVHEHISVPSDLDTGKAMLDLKP